jgi:hypothetical protein
MEVVAQSQGSRLPDLYCSHGSSSGCTHARGATNGTLNVSDVEQRSRELQGGTWQTPTTLPMGGRFLDGTEYGKLLYVRA